MDVTIKVDHSCIIEVRVSEQGDDISIAEISFDTHTVVSKDWLATLVNRAETTPDKKKLMFDL